MAFTLVRTLTHKSNGEHGSSDLGPGPELFLHQSCPRTPAAYPLEFWVSVREEGCAPPFSPAALPGVPKSDRRPVWRRRRFFISSVEDAVLERRAALESLCFGIGFGHLELNCNYNFHITVLCFYIVLYICIYYYIDIIRAALPKSHSIAHVPRTTTTGALGGGVALIYSLAAFQASSFELMGASFSCHRQTINIYVVYRPGHPGTDRAFMEEFGSFLDGLLLVGGNSVIYDDFNYWVDDPSSKPFSSEFVELLDLSNFENFVCFPTHLSGHTHYLILAPAGSEYVKHVEALPIDSDMFDHALILLSLEVMRPHAVKKTITFHSYRNVDSNSIVNDIKHFEYFGCV